jgi:uncharacterized protein YciI
MTVAPPPLDGSVFVLTLTYTAPLERIDALLPAHRRWLDEHYAAGTFLASGPRNPRDGGVILARGRSQADLVALVREDPFAQEEVADYAIVEFQPTRGPLATFLLTGITSGDLEPDSAAASLALEVAQHFHSPPLLNHCVRSYLWAAHYGRARGIAFDAELLYVAAMLHDTGLVPVFDSATVPFEQAGGAVAWVFGAGAGWDQDRRRRTAEVIIAHMADDVDLAVDPEGHLLKVGTGMDISGSRAEDWPATLRTEVLQSHPRLGLAEEFVRCFELQARRKPASQAGRSVARGLAQRVRANPLDAG